MNLERDKFLNVLMGGCWHTDQEEYPLYCYKCECVVYNDTNFSTPEGFLNLWNWAKEQPWWHHFIDTRPAACSLEQTIIDLIHPDHFADVIYEFLRINNE